MTKYAMLNGAAGATGNFFAGLGQGSPCTAPGEYVSTFDYAANADGSRIGASNDVVLDLTTIPEPGTWAMPIAGFGMFVSIRLLRKHGRLGD